MTTNNNSSPNSIFKRIPNNIALKKTNNTTFSTFPSLPPLNSYNYYIYNSQAFNNNLLQNSLSPIYYNYNYLYNIIPSYYSLNKISNDNNLLHKKRKSDNSISFSPKKVQIKAILHLNEKNEKKNLFEINKNYNNKIHKSKSLFKINKNKEETIHCNHFGCDIFFKTKKQAVFHHFKMSQECQEDSINLIKLILETKKIVLKNIEKNNFDFYSKLYENTMKEISLTDYINTITG